MWEYVLLGNVAQLTSFVKGCYVDVVGVDVLHHVRECVWLNIGNRNRLVGDGNALEGSGVNFSVIGLRFKTILEIG